MKNVKLYPYILYSLLVVIYAVLLFFVQPAAMVMARFHVSVLQARFLLLAFAIPYFLIWLAGFYGFERLSSYAERITGSKDGQAVSTLSRGVLFLVLWPPFVSIGDSLLQVTVRHHPNFSAVARVLSNYNHLLWPLIGIILIAAAARKLMALARLQLPYRAIYGAALASMIIGALLAYAVVRAKAGPNAPYPLPLSLTLLTMVVPRTFEWFLGLLATFQIIQYQQKVKGMVYRYCWRLLAYGVGASVVLLMAHSFVVAYSRQLGRLSLLGYLLVIYAILLAIAISYLLIAIGARRLRRIEEV